MRRPFVLLVALAVGTAFTTGCSSDNAASTGEYKDDLASTEAEGHVATINNICPVGLDPLPDDAPTRVYKGHTIGFCCDACPDAFMAWDESARDRWLVAVLQNADYTP
ncbi:MAG: hypothetical protein KDA21_08555 [Phycisphaerales bacterium]|nr:hypothetical protein [Phycisphaerales bacterium]